MTVSEWVMAALGSAGLAGNAAGTLISHGRASKEIEQHREALLDHDKRIEAIADTSETHGASLQLLAQELKHIGERSTDQQRIWTTEIARVNDSVQAGNALLNTRLDGMERLSAQGLEQVQHDIREVRSFVERQPQNRSAVRQGGS